MGCMLGILSMGSGAGAFFQEACGYVGPYGVDFGVCHGVQPQAQRNPDNVWARIS